MEKISIQPKGNHTIAVIVTGSTALKLLCQHVGATCNIVPSDLDIFVTSTRKKCGIDSLTISIDGHSLARGDNKSVTFKHGESSIDVTTNENNLPFVNMSVDGIDIKVHAPKSLRSYYEDENRAKDKNKIEILREIEKIYSERKIEINRLTNNTLSCENIKPMRLLFD